MRILLACRAQHHKMTRMVTVEQIAGKMDGMELQRLVLFEPHTRAIPRHKGGALVEFGRHVVLDEVDGGIVTR